VLIGFRKFIQDEIEEKAARRRKVIPASSEEPLS
jgi:hypothetical protein